MQLEEDRYFSEFVISVSPLKMQYLVKQVQELAVLMRVLDLVIWQDLLVKEKQKKFGFYVENIIRKKH